MKFFNLPDLGEGIPEADIVKWHVEPGGSVREDQILVSVETAKAVVEVPSPITGVIARLCGEPGDTILTGAPLVEFEADDDDGGTVVGALPGGESVQQEGDAFIVGAAPAAVNQPREPVDLAGLARRFNVPLPARATAGPSPLANPEPLKGVRRHMARTMAESHESVVAVTLFDEADIHHWDRKEDITLRVIQAMVRACKVEPALNAWFDGASMSRELFDSVNLGLAIDSGDGLFVPVIKTVEALSKAQVRSRINSLRIAVKDRVLPPSALQGATITLSNFGVFAGRYGTPIVVVPTVCIVGVGRIREAVVSVAGQPESHRLLPLSLSFDHRAVTGGEASRFLATLIEALESS